jgi:hypothetical protein
MLSVAILMAACSSAPSRDESTPTGSTSAADVTMPVGSTSVVSSTATVSDTSSGSSTSMLAEPTAQRTLAPLVGWSTGGRDRPAVIAKNMSVIEATPFDGMVINSYAGYLLFDLDNRELDGIRDVAGSYTSAGIAESFAPLTKASFARMDRNLALVAMGSDGMEPPELFDDANWQRALRNAERFATEIDALGLWGVMLDNEIYSYTYWRFPEDVGDSQRGAAAYVAQSRLRGRQLMEAFRRGKPDITVVVAHGPHEGCGASQTDAGTWADDAFLLGAFAAGVMEGGVAPSRAIDGGELYDLRTAAEFAASTRWRSLTATTAGACPFMDDDLAKRWTTQTGIGYATFDHERPNQRTDTWTPITNMDTVRDTTRLASCNATDIVWAFAEGIDWWADSVDAVPTGAPDAPYWAAIRQGRADAASGRCA